MSTFTSEQISKAIATACEAIGVAQLKAKQEDAIRGFIRGHDVFVCLPTGYGKSLCFALLPLVYDVLYRRKGSIVVCVSPLTSLMMEQATKFKIQGILSEFVGELQQDVDAMIQVKNGMIQLLYISPESLLRNQQWREMLLSRVYQDNLVAVVVDEAHCIARWGEEFRPEYSNIGEVRCLIPTHVNVMALTATASKPSRDFIIHSLRMRKPIVVYIPPMKKNIYYAARSKPEMDEFVKQLASVLGTLRTNMPRLIIFCKRYDECSTMYSMFKASLGNEFTEPPGSPDKPKYRLVDMYTRCTEVAVKKAVLESFCNSEGKLRIVIGTIAFGMGIDSPDVRQTIHWGLSSDIESYVQETGRAGRDGYLSCALLLHSKCDRRMASDEMVQYSKNTTVCRRKLLFEDFESSDESTYPCTMCRCCDICSALCKCNMCCNSRLHVQDSFFVM